MWVYFNKLSILYYNVAILNANLKCIIRQLMFYCLSIRAKYEFITLEVLLGKLNRNF